MPGISAKTQPNASRLGTDVPIIKSEPTGAKFDASSALALKTEEKQKARSDGTGSADSSTRYSAMSPQLMKRYGLAPQGSVAAPVAAPATPPPAAARPAQQPAPSSSPSAATVRMSGGVVPATVAEVTTRPGRADADTDYATQSNRRARGLSSPSEVPVVSEGRKKSLTDSLVAGAEYGGFQVSDAKGNPVSGGSYDANQPGGGVMGGMGGMGGGGFGGGFGGRGGIPTRGNTQSGALDLSLKGQLAAPRQSVSTYNLAGISEAELAKATGLSRGETRLGLVRAQDREKSQKEYFGRQAGELKEESLKQVSEATKLDGADEVLALERSRPEPSEPRRELQRAKDKDSLVVHYDLYDTGQELKEKYAYVQTGDQLSKLEGVSAKSQIPTMNDKQSGANRAPVLGDVPLLGRAFITNKKVADTTEFIRAGTGIIAGKKSEQVDKKMSQSEVVAGRGSNPAPNNVDFGYHTAVADGEKQVEAERYYRKDNPQNVSASQSVNGVINGPVPVAELKEEKDRKYGETRGRTAVAEAKPGFVLTDEVLGKNLSGIDAVRLTTSTVRNEDVLAESLNNRFAADLSPTPANHLKSIQPNWFFADSDINRVGEAWQEYEARDSARKNVTAELGDIMALTDTDFSVQDSRQKELFGNAVQGIQKAAELDQAEHKIATPAIETEKIEDLAEKAKTASPVPQPEVSVAENSFSTFSLNVSDVSFKLAAASLEKGVLPDPSSIRSEEFINVFDYRDREPAPGSPIAFTFERAQYPFAHNRDLLRFSVRTAALGRDASRPLNLVLLLDNSGSMERADRVRIIQESLKVLASKLQAQDRISVVTFARRPRLAVDNLPGDRAMELAETVGKLPPQGGTNLEEALRQAYDVVLRHFIHNGINRIVLMTDGAANLGNVNPTALKSRVEQGRKQGIAFDCFGIGWEGFNDDLLEELSRNGDGRYGFVNTPEEATSEFAAQLAGALQVAASDVKVQVEFNPKRVVLFRQIGYAKHQLTKQQFRDNTVDAAEIGAAESGNALYTVQVNPKGQGDIGKVRVRYKTPSTSEYHEHEFAVPYTGAGLPMEKASPALRLACASAAFAEWLTSSPFAAEVTPDKLLRYLTGMTTAFPGDPRPRRLEDMIRQAKSISGR